MKCICTIQRLNSHKNIVDTNSLGTVVRVMAYLIKAKLQALQDVKVKPFHYILNYKFNNQ